MNFVPTTANKSKFYILTWIHDLTPEAHEHISYIYALSRTETFFCITSL